MMRSVASFVWSVPCRDGLGGSAVPWLWVAMAGAAGVYQLVAAFASIAFLRLRKPTGVFTPPVSILKPVREGHSMPEEALQTNRLQDYPQFEVICGWDNPAVPNRKVGGLIDLQARSHNPIIVVADSDIGVPRDYLRRVVAPLEDPGVGLVTCVYRARGLTRAARFEALGVAIDFANNVLVAHLIGVTAFALGATICIRRTNLDRIGGIRSVGGYLADDYQLGQRIHDLGLKCVLSSAIVETELSRSSWREVWHHQLRWARTVRLCHGAYSALVFTFATTWALLAAASGYAWLAAGVLMARCLAVLAAGWFVLRSSDVLRLFWLVPVRDVFASAVWFAGIFGNSVVWGSEHLILDGEGRIIFKGRVQQPHGPGPVAAGPTDEAGRR